MIIKIPTTFINKTGEILYYKFEGLKDFDYLVILLANKAIEEVKTLEEVFLLLTKTKNDYFLLLEKRFESLFLGSSLETFLEQEDEIKEAKNKVRKVISKSNISTYSYFLDLKLYLYQNNFYTFLELKEILEKEINKESDQEFVDFWIHDDSDLIEQEEKFEYNINSELTKFSILNLFNQNDKIIIKKIINFASEQSKEMLPNREESKIEIPTIKKWNNELIQLNRSYKRNGTRFTDLINLEDKIINNLKLELDMRVKNDYKNYFLIVSQFQEFKSIYFALEKRFDFLTFKNQPIYEWLLTLLNGKGKKELHLDNNFNEAFIYFATTKIEFEIIKNKMNSQLNLPALISKINLMEEYNVNLFEDKNYIITTLYNKYLNDNPEIYYKYLLKFFPKLLLEEIFIKQRITLLNTLLIKNSAVLTKNDKKWIEDFINNKDYLLANIQGKIDSFASIREHILDLQLENNKRIENDKNESNNKDYLKIDDKLMYWKKICNYFVHFNSFKTKYKNDEIAISDEYYEMIDLKKRIYQIQKNDYTTYNLNNNDLNNLSKVESDYKKTINKIEKILS